MWLNVNNKQREIFSNVKNGYKKYCQHFKTWVKECLDSQIQINKMSNKMVSKEYF